MGKSKYLTVLASFVLALGLYGCSGENSPVDPVNPDNGGTEKPEAKGKQFRGFIDSTAMRESNGSRTLGVYGELDPLTHKPVSGSIGMRKKIRIAHIYIFGILKLVVGVGSQLATF